MAVTQIWGVMRSLHDAGASGTIDIFKLDVGSGCSRNGVHYPKIGGKEMQGASTIDDAFASKTPEQ